MFYDNSIGYNHQWKQKFKSNIYIYISMLELANTFMFFREKYSTIITNSLYLQNVTKIP